jgi:hypothetical protein
MNSSPSNCEGAWDSELKLLLELEDELEPSMEDELEPLLEDELKSPLLSRELELPEGFRLSGDGGSSMLEVHEIKNSAMPNVTEKYIYQKNSFIIYSP